MTDQLVKMLNELIEVQRNKLFTIGQRLHPRLTMDDLLQPNDYPELENHPVFRYEEGILHGLQAARAAALAALSN